MIKIFNYTKPWVFQFDIDITTNINNVFIFIIVCVLNKI